MANRLMVRVALPTLATAVTTSAIAVAITYATAWRHNVWAWLAVGLLTVASAGVSVWLYRQQASGAPPDVSAAGDFGSNDLTVGRNARFGLVRLVARDKNRLKLGAKAHADTLQMVAGLPPPREDPGPGAIPDDSGSRP